MSAPFASLDLDKLSLKSSKRASVVSRTAVSTFQEKRRKDALSRQEQARQERTQRARELALQTSEGPQDEDLGDAGDESVARTTPRNSYREFAGQLLQPEWLIDIPADFYKDWYVMPRPEGQRCLVIASKGQTVSRLRNGMKLHQFPSHLPSGSRRTLAGPDDFSILDCIFSEPESTYYIMDLMCWKGYSLYDCSTEFRLFWRESKLREDLEAAEEGKAASRYRFAPVPVHTCTSEGLRKAHSGEVPFCRDGCYFLHKECRYDPDGPTPLALFWKDPACSQFFMDTDMKGNISQYQHVVLKVSDDGCVVTGDDPPLILGQAPHSDGCSHRPGKLLRFSIQEQGIQLQDGAPKYVDLHYEGTANQRRGRVDLWSKILFQHMARTRPLLLEDLLPGDQSDTAMD